MFRVEIRPDGLPGRKRYFAIDESRQASLESLGGVAGTYGVERAALLSWGERQIPLAHTIERAAGVDPVTGETYASHVFAQFGQCSTAQQARGVGPYTFVGEEERDVAMMLAVEAILVTVYACSSPPYRASINRFRIAPEGRTWTIADFGYGESAPVQRIGQ
jgi:hypothetical protein